MTRIALALLALMPLAYGQGAGRYYKNERWGYRLRAPRDWKAAALQSNEVWIASKHIGPQRLTSKRGDEAGFIESDHPEMWVMGFPHGLQRGAKVVGDDKKTEVRIENPYRGYKHLLKENRHFLGGGYHFTKEEETEIDGVKVTQYEILVDKMVASPYRVTTWVYHFEDADFAVQFRILDDYHDKHRAAFYNCLKSFRRIDREGPLPGTGARTGDSISVEEDDDEDLTPEERKKRRKARFEKMLEREVAALPDGWYVMKSDNFVCLANCSRNFARDVVRHAEAIRHYLDDTFGEVGSDYVPKGILRVFETSAEYSAYAQGTSWSWVPEVTTTEERKTDGRKTWAMEPVSAGVTSQWLSFKNEMLADNLPWWFRFGLRQHMRFARVRGRRVRIKPDDWDREQIKRIIKSGKALPVRDLFEKGNKAQAYTMQCGSVISFMLTRGNRGKLKDIIPRYMQNMIDAIEEAEKEYDRKRAEAKKAEAERRAASGGGGGESEVETGEEEDDAYVDAWKKALKERAEAIRKNSFEATFGELSDRDWERLDRAWRRHAG